VLIGGGAHWLKVRKKWREKYGLSESQSRFGGSYLDWHRGTGPKCRKAKRRIVSSIGRRKKKMEKTRISSSD